MGAGLSGGGEPVIRAPARAGVPAAGRVGRGRQRRCQRTPAPYRVGQPAENAAPARLSGPERGC